MTDFLTFLNTADLDTLTKIPGVNHTIAENIIAARPFDFVEDCAKVRGVGKYLLGQMQSFFEAELNDSRSSAMIPVEEDALPALIGKSQPAEKPVEDQPSFLSRLGQAFLNFLRTLLRLILTLAVIVGIGAAIYFGIPYIRENFIAPVEQNTVQINQLRDEIAALQTQLNEMNTRVDTVEKTIETHSISITKLDEMQATLEQEIATQNNSVMIALKREIKLTRTIETLARARLYLSQSNFGLAREDVQTARDLLVELQNQTKDEVLAQAISRLDLALNNLPDFAVVAAGDLEIAWQILMTGESVNTTNATSTPEPLTSQTFTPTPAAIPTFTPTPFELPTATSTP